MRRRYRGRKPRVLWLPVQGNDLAPEAEGNWSAGGIAGSFNVQPDGAIYGRTDECTFDYSDSASAEQGAYERSLQDLTSGNNFRLRRIVGKCFIGAGLAATGTGYPTLDVAAGFMVNRTDDDGNPYQSASFQPEAGPLHQDSQEDPWIWRRRWLLSPVSPNFTLDWNAGNIASFAPIFPPTTCHYGSVADGPHIDQKTARVIGRQERLYFWIQARMLNYPANTGVIDYYVDLRLLGSLRSAVGNRRNASR